MPVLPAASAYSSGCRARSRPSTSPSNPQIDEFFFFCLLFYYLDPRVLKVLEDKDDLVVKTQSLDQSDDVVLPTGQLQEPGLVVDPCR